MSIAGGMIAAGILSFSFILAPKGAQLFGDAVCLAGCGASAPPSFSHASTLGSEEWSRLLAAVLTALFVCVAGYRLPLGY